MHSLQHTIVLLKLILVILTSQISAQDTVTESVAEDRSLNLEQLKEKFATKEELELLSLKLTQVKYEMKEIKEVMKKIEADHDKEEEIRCRQQGVVTLKLDGKPQQLYCDLKEDGAGFVIQRRINGTLDFFKGWNDYVDGFGNMEKEFWLGLDKIASITATGRYVLRIDLEDFKGNKRYAEYDDFKINKGHDKYKLISTGTYTGNAGDAINAWTSDEEAEVGQQFSTQDRDNDASEFNNCAEVLRGGWWYSNCGKARLNDFRMDTKDTGKGMQWETWGEGDIPLSGTQMKLRPYSSP